MSRTFSVSRAVVTGAARGIGFAIARRLAEDGLRVSVLDLAPEDAERAAREIGPAACGFACDVSRPEQVNAVIPRAAEAMGGLDALICNAGITRDAMLHRMTDEQWEAVIDVHLKGTFNCLRAAAPYLRADDSPGRVVCISSVSGAMGNLGQINYTAAKGGIVAMAKTAARELARFRVTVNAIRPGFIETAMTDAIPEDTRNLMIAMIPLARPGRPEDVAAAVSFLCSDDAAYMTGAVLDVNGGFYM